MDEAILLRPAAAGVGRYAIHVRQRERERERKSREIDREINMWRYLSSQCRYYISKSQHHPEGGETDREGQRDDT